MAMCEQHNNYIQNSNLKKLINNNDTIFSFHTPRIRGVGRD